MNGISNDDPEPIYFIGDPDDVDKKPLILNKDNDEEEKEKEDVETETETETRRITRSKTTSTSTWFIFHWNYYWCLIHK